MKKTLFYWIAVTLLTACEKIKINGIRNCWTIPYSMAQLKLIFVLFFACISFACTPSNDWNVASMKVEISNIYYNKTTYTYPDKLTIDERNSLTKRGGEPVCVSLQNKDCTALNKAINTLRNANLATHYGFGDQVELGIIHEISIELKNGENITLLINNLNETEVPTVILDYIYQFNLLKEKP